MTPDFFLKKLEQGFPEYKFPKIIFPKNNGNVQG